jgi:hypothetical protein
MGKTSGEKCAKFRREKKGSNVKINTLFYSII